MARDSVLSGANRAVGYPPVCHHCQMSLRECRRRGRRPVTMEPVLVNAGRTEDRPVCAHCRAKHHRGDEAT